MLGNNAAQLDIECGAELKVRATTNSPFSLHAQIDACSPFWESSVSMLKELYSPTPPSTLNTSSNGRRAAISGIERSCHRGYPECGVIVTGQNPSPLFG